MVEELVLSEEAYDWICGFHQLRVGACVKNVKLLVQIHVSYFIVTFLSIRYDITQLTDSIVSNIVFGVKLLNTVSVNRYIRNSHAVIYEEGQQGFKQFDVRTARSKIRYKTHPVRVFGQRV